MPRSSNPGTDRQYLRNDDIGGIFRFDHCGRNDAGTDFHQLGNFCRHADRRHSGSVIVFDRLYHSILLYLSDSGTFLL